MAAVNVFDFVKSVTETKVDMYEGNESQYNPFVVNKALSFNVDCLMFVQELNKYSSIPKDVQYKFLLNSLDKRKRYGRWVKRDTVTDDVALIKSIFDYSDEKAATALNLLTDRGLLELRELTNKGGQR